MSLFHALSKNSKIDKLLNKCCKNDKEMVKENYIEDVFNILTKSSLEIDMDNVRQINLFITKKLHYNVLKF